MLQFAECDKVAIVTAGTPFADTNLNRIQNSECDASHFGQQGISDLIERDKAGFAG